MADRFIYGLKVVPNKKKKHPVLETRVLRMPDGNDVICRLRQNKDVKYWTAEVPLEIAKEVFDEQ